MQRLTAKAIQDLERRVGRQVPFAGANAINATLNDGQKAMRERIDAVFTVRAPTFVNRLVKIGRDDRATKTRLVGRVRIEGPDSVTGRDTALKAQILLRHQDGGTATAYAPPFYIPSDGLRAQYGTAPIPRKLYPSALRIFPRRDAKGVTPGLTRVTKAGRVQVIGKQRTFVLTNKGGEKSFGIYQREGPGKYDIALLWSYANKVTIKPRLRAGETIERAYASRFPINYRASLNAALRTAF